MFVLLCFVLFCFVCFWNEIIIFLMICFLGDLFSVN